jgi:hypothetical protein
MSLSLAWNREIASWTVARDDSISAAILVCDQNLFLEAALCKICATERNVLRQQFTKGYSTGVIMLNSLLKFLKMDNELMVGMLT